MGKTIAVGLSGGVDSSVAALLLKEQGHHVIGFFMKNWEEDDASGECAWKRDYDDVVKIANKLEIPFYSFNFSKEYWDAVFQTFLKELEAGNTPNPDILCNREIKFHHFHKKALSLGADYVATGHYAQIDPERGFLKKGKDASKDQTYFLYAIQKEVLRSVLFPIGHLPKHEVRALAKKHGLATHDKKDSTGICFIGKKPFASFVGQYLKCPPGPIKTLDGKVLGTHQGAIYYTIGQRKGLGIGGPGEAWFVAGKNVAENTVYVVQGTDHPALYACALVAKEAHWIGDEPAFPLSCNAKIRYRQGDEPCNVEKLESGYLKVTFKRPQRAITPQQSVVFYDGEICLGGAFIANALGESQ